MSTIALSVVGSVVGNILLPGIGGLIGGAIRASAGSYIDNQFLLPALFGGQSGPRPQRLKDLQITTASEGDPMNVCIGPQNRVGGTLIWTTNLKESDKKVKTGKSGSADTYTYSCSFAVAVCEGPIYQVSRIWANGKVIYSIAHTPTFDTSAVKGITFYKGTEDQLPDPLMQAALGANNTPAYRGTAYVVFDTLQLTNFGNALPTMQFEVNQVDPATGLTVSSAIKFIMNRAGFDDDELNFELTNHHQATYFGGYTWAGPQNTISLLEPILAAFDINTRESEGVFYFVKRGYGQQVPVVATDLTARQYGPNAFDLPNRPIRFIDAPNTQVPSNFIVRYVEHGYDYQQAEQRESMINHPYTKVDQIDLPLVISGKQARSMALTRLVRAYTERMMAHVDLPPRYLHVEENDILLIPYLGREFEIRVTQIDRGNNWLLNIQGILQGTISVPDRNVACRTTSNQYGTPYDPGAVNFYLAIIDGAALSTANATAPGIYFAAAVASGTDFRGAELFESPDGVNGWIDSGPVSNSGVIGYAITALPSGPIGYWDNSSTVDVYLFTGTIEHDFDQHVLNGTNRIFIGGECVGFGKATLTAARTYRLSHLLRGLNSTEDKIGTHAAGETAVLFDADTVAFAPLNLSDMGSTRTFEIVPVGGMVGDFNKHDVTFGGGTLKQYAPCHLQGNGAAAGSDFVITWERRTREPDFPIFGNTPPLLAAAESYTVEIYKAHVLLRTATTTSPTFTWTAAMQTADSFSGGEVGFQVSQMNDYAQKGWPARLVATM